MNPVCFLLSHALRLVLHGVDELPYKLASKQDNVNFLHRQTCSLPWFVVRFRIHMTSSASRSPSAPDACMARKALLSAKVQLHRSLSSVCPVIQSAWVPISKGGSG
eukprot:16432580-Heterocapsa_arctica.AAC.1